MTTTLDATNLPASERAAFVKDTLRGAVTPLEIEHHDPDVRLQLRTTPLADISVLTMSVSDSTFERTPKQARDDAPPTVYLALQLTGVSRVSQDTRSALIRPGALVLTRSNSPATVAVRGGSTDIHLHVPMGQLDLPERVLSRVTALRFGPEQPLARVVASHLRELAEQPLPPADARALDRPTVALVQALVSLEADMSDLAKVALAETLQDRVVAYLHEHWRDHDLTANSIAAAHHVSTRYVYALLKDAGISLGDWVRSQRLEACRHDLTRAGTGSHGVAAVGRRWGFRDPTNFGRAFKRAYGITPGSWRALHADAGSGAAIEAGRPTSRFTSC